MMGQVSGQDRVGMFWNYTINDGLPSNEVYHIHEDAKGYIWFSTSNGISRFDGYEFLNFSTEHGVSDSDIFQIEEDSKGRLYLYSMSGTIYEGDAFGFKVWKHQQLIDSICTAQLPFLNHVYGKIVIDADDKFHYLNGGIQITVETDTFVSVERNYGTSQIILNNPNEMLLIPAGGWITPRLGNQFDSISLIDNEAHFTFAPMPQQKLVMRLSPNRFTSPNARYMRKWNYFKWNDKDYFVSLEGSLALFSKAGIKWQSAFPGTVEVIRPVNDGLAIGLLNNDGLHFYRTLQELYENSPIHLLDGFSISFVYVDQKDNFWVSTINGGVFRVSKSRLTKSQQFASAVTSGINNLTSDGHCVLFFSDAAEIITSYDLKSGTLDYMAKHTGTRIKKLHYDAESDALWLADWTVRKIENDKLETYLLDGEHRYMFSPRPTEQNIPLRFGGNDIHVTKRGIWAANAQGFALYDESANQPVYVEYPLYGNESLRINAIFEESNNLIWLGTQHGVFTYDLDTVTASADSLLGKDIPIIEITKSPLGTFFGTSGYGVYHLKGEETVQIDRRHCLSSNKVTSLLGVDSIEMWVGTNNGLNRLRFDSTGQFQIQYYTVATGLPSNSIADMTYCDGMVYVATSNGLGLVDPDEVITVAPVTPIFRDILVNNTPQELSQHMRFGRTEHNLGIRYDCLDYKQFGKILFRYRLKQSEPWQETKERAVNFLRLAPGIYTFEVQALGVDRTWSASEILEFSIAAPIWKKGWFWLVVLIALVSVVYTIVRSRFQKLRKTVLLQQRITELERAALRSQMNPHFIFNVLHSIQGYIVDGDSKNATRYIAKFSRIIRATLNHSRMTKIPLDDEIRNLKEYLDLENMRLNGELSYSFVIDENVPSDALDIPPMLIQPFLENAIQHGIIPKGKKGHIEVIIGIASGYLLIEIIDDGIGFDESLKQNNNNIKDTSLGLKITKERLAMLDRDSTEDHVVISALRDGAGNPVGTRVVVRIKVEEALP